MNRRSFLTFLGLAPVAAPAAVAAASAPALPPIDYATLAADARERISHIMEVERYAAEIAEQVSSDHKITAEILEERYARISADTCQASYVGALGATPL